MLSSNTVLSVQFDEKDLMKLNEKRLKALKKSCYSFVGNRFYCCECHREFMLRDEEEKEQYLSFYKALRCFFVFSTY